VIRDLRQQLEQINADIDQALARRRTPVGGASIGQPIDASDRGSGMDRPVGGGAD
jgi:hypothetical protein